MRHEQEAGRAGVQGATRGWISAGPLRLEPSTGRVTVRDRDLSLTDMERRVLMLLLAAGGKPVTRDAMLSGLYPGEAPEARVVDVFVCRLRAKLAKAGLYCVIGTVWRRGYVLKIGATTPEPPAAEPLPTSLLRVA